MKKSIIFLMIMIIFGSSSVYAMERFDIITTQQLKQMLDERNVNKIDFILVNSLDEILYRNAAIPGSINVPWSRVDELVSRLGDDKEKLIVTY